MDKKTKWKGKLQKRSVQRRVLSFLIAFVMLLGSVPLGAFDGLFESGIKSEAANKDSFTPLTTDPTPAYLQNGIYVLNDTEQLVTYSKAYFSFPGTHQNDTVQIALGQEDSDKDAAEFIALGTKSYPFKGKIILPSSALNYIKLSEAFFGYVYDSAKIVDSNAGNADPTFIQLERIYENTNEPMFARYVVHDTDQADSWNGNTWCVQVEKYSDGTSSPKSYNYAGIIGTIEKGAKVTLEIKDGTEFANIVGNDDLGYVCGHMDRNSRLTISSISGITTTDSGNNSVTTTNSSYSITTSSGNVGGVVGSMDDKAVLTLNGNLLNAAPSITTSNGYAGGIVGYNDGGIVKINSSYSVGGTIAGTTAAGGLFGYYRPIFDDPTTTTVETTAGNIDLTVFPSISATINGQGNIGGLFGVLENKTVTIDDSTDPATRTDATGGTFKVSGTKTITVTSNASAGALGGIAGTYNPYSLAESFEIENATVTATNSGSYKMFGGGIGMIGMYENDSDIAAPAYIKFNSFTVNATGCGTRYFGGLVGKGDEAFVAADTVTVTASGFHGGAAVGCLARGVLKLSGNINFSDAVPSVSSVDAIRDGQIVGYRDDALVYADNWTSFSRSTSKIDNIGSWGDIIVFDSTKLTKASVLTENTGHTITMVSPASSISSTATYATQALAMQISYSNNPIITNGTIDSPSSLTFSGATITLTGTGIKGLTRDNCEDSNKNAPWDNAKCSFGGTITGGGSTVTLDIQNVTSKAADGDTQSTLPIYRHYYNGMIGIANNVSINNLTFGGTINVVPERAMYAGMGAARAKGYFKADTVSVSGTFTTAGSSTDGNKHGESVIYMGRLVGEIKDSDSTTISSVDYNIYVSGGTYGGTISGTATNESNCFGGVIGRISSTETSARNWYFSGITITGKVENTFSKELQRLGGLIAEIAAYTTSTKSTRELTLNNVTVNNFEVSGSATTSSGGLLGHTWHTTNVNVGTGVTSDDSVGVTVNGTSKVKLSGSGSTAGLVYRATGKWMVNKVAFSAFSTDAASATSFGMLVNKGWHKEGSVKQAIYMILPSGYSYTAPSNFTTESTVFDELVAYSAEDGNVTQNGQGIVSIHSSGDTITMTGSGDGNTYAARTAKGKSTVNSNTRYYYNLDTIAVPKGSTASGDQVKLMNWGLNKYACANIQDYFVDSYTSGTISGSFDMAGYSWYPIDVDSNITVSGTFKLYNSELEKNEQAKTDTKYSTLSTTQHYLMHNALFNDVNKKLTIGSVTLQGNVGKTSGESGGSGALVFGTVKGSSSSDSGTAEVKVTTGITLDGIHVHNFNPASDSEYAPLLINQTGDFSKLTIKNVVVNNNASYKTSDVITLKTKNNVTGSSTYTATTNPKVATSLVGKVGVDKNSKNINIEFSEIQLDGRKAGALPNDNDLLTAYHTDESLFTKATLVDTFVYGTGGGTYNYTLAEDWTGTAHTPAKVTYGAEISCEDGRTEYAAQEFWYDGQSHTDGVYTHPVGISPDSGNGGVTTDSQGNITGYTAPYSFSGFLPYVFTKYNSTNKTHQLKVNHTSASFTGCGTYNDPYIITSGTDLVNIENIINGDYNSITLGSICLPTKTVEGHKVFDPDATWHDDAATNQHESFTKSGAGDSIKYIYGTSEEVDLTALRTYLAGAYYKIADNSTITIESDEFKGLGYLSDANDTFAVFRGVITGSGNETIVNQTEYPLIASSYGSVIRGVTIHVDKAISKNNATATTSFKLDSTGCQYYGAVIGQIFGGDNIIDNVYVEFGSNASITIGGDKPHVIPVGGYVGVLLNGGLYFRNMSSGNVAGLPNNITYKGDVNVNSDSLIYTSSTKNNVRSYTTTPNMKYLYVNPIIGRVMNGFAITETDKFRPFEDGTRTYPDGSCVYFDGTNFVEKAAGVEYNGDKVGVTMRNGKKNYSIADINMNASDTFDMKKNNATSDADGATITIHNAQELFLISCITQAGLGQSNTGQYFDEKQYYNFENESKPHDDFFIQSYADNMSTHHGNYNEIGNSSSTDYGNNAIYDTHSGSTDTIPHIIKKYSPAIDTNHYAAFNITNTSRFYYMTLAKNNNNTQTFYLPDGYRGIGCMLLTSTNDSVKNQLGTGHNIKKIKNDDYYIYLAGFEGNENIVSLNMSYYSYGSSNDNYSTPKNGNNSTLDLGFGFFNGIRCKYVTTNDTTKSATKIKNIHLKGSVDFDIKTTDGASANYSNDENAAGLLSTGGFTGAVGSDDKNTYYFENISLDKISISGCKFTGGMVGCINLGSGGSGEFHTNKCSADEITVFGGHYAGGMVGLVRNADAKFIAEFDEGSSFVIKSISSGLNDFGAGGLIGCNRSKTNCTITNLCIDGAIVRDASGNAVTYEGTDTPKRLGYIGNSTNNNYSGGIIGYTRRNPNIKIDSCEVKNVVIRGRRVGGAIGYLSSQESGAPRAEIISFKLTAENSDSVLLSRFDNDTGACGGIIGFIDSAVSTAVKMIDCAIDGYTITSPKNAGGIIGKILNNQSVVAENISINAITIKNTKNSGGLVGYLNNGSLCGYNILTNNITYEKYADADMSSCGHIVGYNNSRVIKLVGFSRQGTGIQENTVGNKNANDPLEILYGSGGYVIFSDYTGTSLNSTPNDTYSTITAKKNNVSGAKDTINATANSPYVTVNPKRDVTSDNKFLTGDGIANASVATNYSNSAIGKIISDASTDSAKRYQSYSLPTGKTLNNFIYGNSLTECVSTKYMTYEKARGTSSLGTDLKRMPVLVVDDINIDNTHALVNTYLQLLTNTDYNYADKSKNTSIYQVRIAKCTYTNGNLSLEYNDSSDSNVNLKRANSQFKISGSYDNGGSAEQFTLIDIEYYDPTDSTKIAYHLYVPVFVKKMLHYSFDISTMSGTTYRTQPYIGIRGNAIIENLGNPITMQFRWTYEQTLQEWVNQINGGESLLRNYDKQLEFKDHTSHGLTDGTRMALVDANRNNKAYYATEDTSGLITLDSVRSITCINLNTFKDSSSTPVSFEPIVFNDFFDIYDVEPSNWETDGYIKTELFVPTESTDTEKKLKTNSGQYYKPGTGTGEKYLYIKYKDGMYSGNNLVEDYYITFFTPEPTNSTPVSHYEFKAPLTFGDNSYPSNCSGRTATHMFTGKIFENRFTIESTNSNPDVSAANNNFVTATLAASVGVTPSAGSVIGTYLNMDSVSIYQSFLLSLNKSYYVNEVLKTDKGIAEGSNPKVDVQSFTINGDSVDDLTVNGKLQIDEPTAAQATSCLQMSGDNAHIDANNLELRCNVNLKRYVFNAYSAYLTAIAANPNDETATTTFDIISSVKLTYLDNDKLAAQFPENSDPVSDTDTGTTISGDSNISSQAIAAVNSKTTAHHEDTSPKYYLRSIKKATLNYYSADTKTTIVTPADGDTPAVTREDLLVANKYEQLGINALDPERKDTETSTLNIKTQADYNITNLSRESKNSIHSIKVVVSLRRMADYSDETGKLPISEFLPSLTLYQNEGKTLTLTKDNANSTDTDWIYYANITSDDFTNDNFRIPIDFSVYTGENSNFESKSYSDGEETKHMYYSNYMVKLDVELYTGQNLTGTMVNGSDAFDHVIYTNSKIYYEIVPGS